MAPVSAAADRAIVRTSSWLKLPPSFNSGQPTLARWPELNRHKPVYRKVLRQGIQLWPSSCDKRTLREKLKRRESGQSAGKHHGFSNTLSSVLSENLISVISASMYFLPSRLMVAFLATFIPSTS